MDLFLIHDRVLSPDQLWEHNASRYNTLAANETAKGEAWHCAVRPLDDTLSGLPLNSSFLVIGNLPPGTYYFVATAYDSSGRESEFSGVVSKTIGSVRPAPSPPARAGH